MVACFITTTASAQTAAGRLEVAGGLRWNGATTFAEMAATETSVGGQRLTLFKSRSALESSPGVEARVGFALAALFEAEAAVSYNTRQLRTDITADFEGAQAVAVSEPIKQFIVQGGLVMPLRMVGSLRVTPFASGGAGYLRQLHEGQTLIESGLTYYVGGGVNVLLRSGAGRIKTTGLRADVRAQFLADGVAPGGGTYAVPAAGASLFVRF